MYNIAMRTKRKKVRKCITINPVLLKKVRKILNASSDNEAIEMALKPIADRKTDEEIWRETKKFIRHLQDQNFKPLFS